MRRSVLLASALTLASPALAQSVPATPGTDAGAKALQADLSAYTGSAAFDTGLLTVAPDPGGYRIQFKFDSMLDGQQAAGAVGSIKIADYSVIVSSQPDGNWSVTSSDPLSAAYDLMIQGERAQLDYQLGEMAYSGIFSPALGSFLSATGRSGQSRMKQTDTRSDMTATMGEQTFDMTGTPNGGGAIDLAFNQAGKDFIENISTQLDPANPDQRIDMTFGAKGFRANGTGTAMKSRAIMDLYAFAVQNLDKEKMVSAQGELKTRLRSALPVWDAMNVGYSVDTVDIGTPVGGFKASNMSMAMQADGIESDGAYTMSFGFGGFSVDSALVPAWAVSLVPADFALSLKVGGVDLATPASIAIDDFDLKRDQPFSPEAGQKIAASFSEKTPRVDIEPSRIKAADYELTMAGQLAFEGGNPSGTLSFEVAGLDTVVKTLQEAGATDQRALQIVGPLSIAQGMAKRLDDGRVQWLVDYKADGTVSINGTQIKGPDGPTPPPGYAPGEADPAPLPQ